ncbi:hypothetical protein BC939DRAFT_208127 [Gamsiella multidivaricata]|uniref:uncharacterized protein n=1 Tax=Gamsiella multidivaricata TaxID=101098 RepID=UPI00221E8524|nr:uncharacterized protein BC939DRAFT_208127 [Gamsiella multidivaricata]KAI7821376.1 hypothetical protein BC939DRAFT_208127 [Gamsiella multidivaricata]
MPRYLTDCAAARGKDRGLKQLDLMDEAATILTVRHEAEEAKAELRSTGPPSSLRRDISLIIPSMISTQEVLQNLGQYSNKGHVYSDEDEEDLVLGQRHNSVQNSASAATIYDEVSPIIPPLTPLPSSLPLAIPSKERHVTSRQASSHKRQAAPPHTINSGDGDDDPIMDFEDSGDDNGIVDINSVEDPDPIVSSISPSLVSSPRHLIRQPLGLNAIRPLGPPTSPSRRFVIPSAAAITPGNRGQVPDSPSKRLRPISELPRPVAPPFLQMQRSPGRRGIPGSPSKRQSKGRKGSAHADVLIQPVTEASAARTTLSPAPKRTPTTRVSEIARALKNVQPPPLLAPQLLQLAEESRHRKDRDLYEDDEELEPRARKRGRQGLDKGLDQNRKAAHIEKDALPVASSGCMEHTINSSWAPPSYTGSPELSMKEEPKLSPVSPHSALEVKKQVVSEESPEKRIAQSPFLVSPPSPTLEGMRRIKKEESSTPLLGMLKKMSGSQSCLPTSHPESAQVSKHPQEQSSRELLQHPPPLSRQDQSQECHQMKSYRKVPQQQRSLQPTKPHAEEFIPLPTIVLEHVSKLTPIDHIKWPPAKAGRFHLFALVMSIGPEEQIVTKTGQASAKRQLSICDQSATSFKLDLWRDRCKWADMIKIGDVVMITDVQTKEYRQKVTGSTSAWSKMSRLDGSLLASYQGHVTTESCLKILIEKRRVLALDLLDKDKGIARDPSFYLSLGSVPAQLGATFGATGAALVEQGKGCVQGRAQRGSKAGGSELLSLLSTASMVAPHMNISSNVSAPTPPQFLTGSSIRASVVFRMLRVPGDESQGWEIGAVMSSGRLVKIQSQNTLPWIKDASPGKLLHFFGKFKQGSDICKVRLALFTVDAIVMVHII